MQRVVDYILAGDIFQANVSQRFQAELPDGLDAWGLYRRLRRRNPAPFAAFLDFGEVAIASASPERFLELRERQVETRPIKGTRPRGGTAAEDERLGAELLASAKDRAENVMIVDLLRNDLGRVCRDHTVLTPEICVLESFATVHHLVSTVTGELRTGLDAVDLLRATFPGGSITGAPKIRAMEIIAELEPTRARALLRLDRLARLRRLDGHQHHDPHLRDPGPAGGVPGRRRHRRRQRAGGRVRGDAGQGQGADRGAARVPVILLIDNYDSFVWNLARYVSELGHTRIVVRNDATSLEDIAALAPTHIIVSPGPCTPTEAGISNAVITGFGARIPILGVCLGHQCIGAALGGKVERARRPMHGKTSRISHDGSGRVCRLAGAAAGHALPLADRAGRGPAGSAAGDGAQRGRGDHGAGAPGVAAGRGAVPPRGGADRARA